MEKETGKRKGNCFFRSRTTQLEVITGSRELYTEEIGEQTECKFDSKRRVAPAKRYVCFVKKD